MNKLPDHSTNKQDAASGSRRGGPLRRILTVAVILVIGYFLGRSIWSQWGTISSYPWSIQTGYLVLSVALVWLDFVVLIALWRFLLGRATGRVLPFRLAYRIWFLSNFGKYLPGKVWTVMGMAYLLGEYDYPAPVVVAVAVQNQAFSIFSGILFSVAVLGVGGLHLPLWTVLAGVALGLGVLYPPFFEWLLNLGLRLLKREPVKIALSFRSALMLFGLYLLTWLVYGAAFWVLLRGIGIEPSGGFWPVCAVFAAAYIAGFLTLLAPGGLGPREGILALLSKDFLPAGLAVPVALVARIWMSLAELLGAIPLLWIRGASDTT